MADSEENTDGRIRVVATTTQLADFARQVLGENATISTIYRPNIDPHDYQATSEDAKALEDAQVVLINGVNLEEGITSQLDSARQKGIPFFTAADYITPLKAVLHHHHDEEDHSEEEHEAEEEAEDHDQLDPHIWTSVSNAKEIVQGLSLFLSDQFPTQSETIQSRSSAYLNQLDELDQYIRSQVSTVAEDKRKLVTNHAVLNYYAQAYGFEFVGAVIPSISSEAAPSAQDFAELIDLVRSEGVNAVFAERSINPDLVNQLAQEAGIKVEASLYGDSLGSEGEEGATYIGMMRYNTDKIVEALR